MQHRVGGRFAVAPAVPAAAPAPGPVALAASKEKEKKRKHNDYLKKRDRILADSKERRRVQHTVGVRVHEVLHSCTEVHLDRIWTSHRV